MTRVAVIGNAGGGKSTLNPTLPLILGGHSFIRQLGNDPLPSQDEQLNLVNTCLDQGIRWFDTTYQPERIALGRALHSLDRRDEAAIFAWNFFVDFDEQGEVGGPAYYQPHHIEMMLEQLQTSWIDCLVVHELENPVENLRQLALTQEWQRKGYVKRLGTWYPPLNADASYDSSPFSFMVRPYNITTPDSAQAFTACKLLGWENYACSPFVRGWELDAITQRVQQAHKVHPGEARQRTADILLRYSLYQPNVDRLIVAIRKLEWIEENITSLKKGPLRSGELEWLGIQPHSM